MAYTLAQSKISAALADDVAVVYDSTPTTGHLLLASVMNGTGSSVPTVADSNASWTLLNSRTSAETSTRSIALYGRIAVGSQPTTITATTGGAEQATMNLYAFAGGPATIHGIVQLAATAGGTTAVTNTGSQPSLVAERHGSLIFSQLGVAGGVITAPSTPSGFTLGQAGPSGGIRSVDSYLLASVLGTTYNPDYSWTTSRIWRALTTEIVITRAGIMI